MFCVHICLSWQRRTACTTSLNNMMICSTKRTPSHYFGESQTDNMNINYSSRRQPALGGLIVDFPSRTMHDSSEVSQVTPRAVAFSPTSSLAFIPEDKSAAKAYSREDIRHFKAKLTTDVARMRRDLASPPPEGHCFGQNVCNWVGLERFTTPTIFERSLTARRNHTKTVLRAQEILREQGNQTMSNEAKADVLMRASARSSLWVRQRATRLADAYATFQE